MQWEDDEEDEIQASKATRNLEEKRHNQGRPINAQQHRRKEFPVYDDSFSKRRSTSAMRERPVERMNGLSTGTAKTAEPSRRASMDGISKSCKY